MKTFTDEEGRWGVWRTGEEIKSWDEGKYVRCGEWPGERSEDEECETWAERALDDEARAEELEEQFDLLRGEMRTVSEDVAGAIRQMLDRTSDDGLLRKRLEGFCCALCSRSRESAESRRGFDFDMLVGLAIQHAQRVA